MLTKHIDLTFTLPAPVGIPQELMRYYPTVIDSVSMPDAIMPISASMSIIELATQVTTVSTAEGESSTTYQTGFVDHRFWNPSYNSAPPSLHNMTMRPSFFQWEGAKFMNTGTITSASGLTVSEYTIEEFARYGFTLGDFSDFAGSGWSSGGYSMNVGYPTINNYLSQLDTADLPDENGAGYLATGAVVYCNTTNFPASGKILIGKETISYTSKLSDRFIGCTRGVDGSPIEQHTVGAFLRNAQ